MASEDKDYEQSALGQRVNELMDDGYDFGEAVKQAMSEGLKDGGSVGIEILFGPKRDNFRYGGDTMGGKNDKSKSSPGPDSSKVSAQQQSNHQQAMAAAQGSGGGISNLTNNINKTNFLDKVKNTANKVVDSPLTKFLDPRSKIALAMGGYKFLRDGIPQLEDFENEAINQELENIQTMGGISPYADGGRVGFFMGGPALEGEALSIYNSMSAYGNDDQTIADQLQSLGMYTPPGGTTDTPDTTIQPIGYQGRGNDSPYAGQVVDQTDYGFNKKNYAPGEKLEINPAAFGVSFPEQPSGPKREGIINQTIDSFTSLPTRSLSSFASPTTGGNIVGPAEQGFMGQTLDIDPAGRTREEIRSLYDNYNRFTGRTSNFADARVKGKAGQMIGNVMGYAAGIPFVGKGIDMLSNAFGPQGNKSLQSKYTVDGAGFGNTGARDEFGLATFDKKDGFLGLTGNTTRNYTDRMNERLGELTDFFGSRIEGFDINNLDAETLDKMKDINGFYTKQIQAYKQRTAVEDINKRTQDAVEAQRIAEELAAAAAAKDKAAALAAIKKQGQADYNPNIHGPTNYGRDSQGNQSFDSGQGFGIGSDGGPVSNRTGRGRTGYSEGGLATMFTRRR